MAVTPGGGSEDRAVVGHANHRVKIPRLWSDRSHRVVIMMFLGTPIYTLYAFWIHVPFWHLHSSPAGK